jgi:hypothetical protein
MFFMNDIYSFIWHFKIERHEKCETCRMWRKKKCVSNSLASSHNDSFVLLFLCMFTAFIQLINDKHLEYLNGIQAYLYRYMSAWMFILLLVFDHLPFISTNAKGPLLQIPSFLIFLYYIYMYDVMAFIHQTFAESIEMIVNRVYDLNWKNLFCAFFLYHYSISIHSLEYV